MTLPTPTRILLAAASLCLLAAPALAHPGHIDGVPHSHGGLDLLLTVVGVGVGAALLAGLALYRRAQR